MLIRKTKKDIYLNDLDERYKSLRAILDGRQAEQSDEKHGRKPFETWNQRALENGSIIDTYKLRIAVADFKTILAEIGKLKT